MRERKTYDELLRVVRLEVEGRSGVKDSIYTGEDLVESVVLNECKEGEVSES
jgi:hypothetical protein